MGSQLTTAVLVTSILLLEASMTALTFYTFWTPLTDGLDPFTPEPLPPVLNSLFVVLAPVTGLGEQHIRSSNNQWLINRSDYNDSWLLLLENIVYSQIPLALISYYDGDIWGLLSCGGIKRMIV